METNIASVSWSFQLGAVVKTGRKRKASTHSGDEGSAGSSGVNQEPFRGSTEESDQAKLQMGLNAQNGQETSTPNTNAALRGQAIT